MKNIFRRYQVWEYNIGFLSGSPDLLVQKEMDFSKVVWLKHKYKDRMFADPFILNVTESEIEVLVEESRFLGKGTALVKLTIDAKTFCLLRRKVVLYDGSHFSYPYIIRKSGGLYLLPENISSGRLNLYRYDEQQEKCIFYKLLLPEPISDPDIICIGGKYWLLGGKAGTDQHDLYLWQSDDLFGEYRPRGGKLVKSDWKGSRMAGASFSVGNHLFRPSQDCDGSYGKGVIIQKITDLSLSNYAEEVFGDIYPQSSAYPDGLHTINFYKGWCVIDGLCKRCDFMRGLTLRICKKSGIHIFD